MVGYINTTQAIDQTLLLMPYEPIAKLQCAVVLVSFGDHSTQRLSLALNKLGVKHVVMLPHETPNFIPTHVILSGGPGHVYESNHDPMPQWVLDGFFPVLGVCYGMQLIAHTFGGTVKRMSRREEGPVEVTEMIYGNQEINFRWMNRYDQVTSIPLMFTITGVTSNDHVASFTDHKKWWAVQYHPESHKHGDLKVLNRFLRLKSLIVT